MTIQEEHLVNEIKEFLQSSIRRLERADEKWKNCVEDVLSDIDIEIRNTQDTLEDYEEENLKLNHLELEGYLRALITIKNLINSYKPQSDEIEV